MLICLFCKFASIWLSKCCNFQSNKFLWCTFSEYTQVYVPFMPLVNLLCGPSLSRLMTAEVRPFSLGILLMFLLCRTTCAGALGLRLFRTLFSFAMSSPKTSPVLRAEIRSSNSPSSLPLAVLLPFDRVIPRVLPLLCLSSFNYKMNSNSIKFNGFTLFIFLSFSQPFYIF